MRTAQLNGIELAYDVQGEGEPCCSSTAPMWADFLAR